MKKKKSPLKILLILLSVLVIGAIIAFVLKYPAYKVCSYIENGEIAEADEVYKYVILKSDKEAIGVEALNYSENLLKSYLKDKSEYRVVLADFDILKEAVLKDDKDFDEIYECLVKTEESKKAYEKGLRYMEDKEYDNAVTYLSKVWKEDEARYEDSLVLIDRCNVLIASLEAYEEGVTLFDNGEYLQAIESFELVDETDDDHYEAACEYIELCNAYLSEAADNPEGTWTTTANIGDFVADMLGYPEYEVILNVDVTVSLLNNGQGSINCMVSKENRAEFITSMQEPATQYICDNYDVSPSGVTFLLAVLGKDMETIIDEYLEVFLEGTSYENIFTEGYTENFSYEYDDETIYSDGEPFFDYELSGCYMEVEYVGDDETLGQVISEKMTLTKK